MKKKSNNTRKRKKKNQYSLSYALAFAILVIAAIITWIEIDSIEPPAPIERTFEVVSENKYPLAPEFYGITNWINSEPLTMKELKGKVVLIDFWTYTCINCIRTLPHVTSWHEKYADQGLVIVGVHSPEFFFEKKTENVVEAMEKHDIKYPVAQDNDFVTWTAWRNRYWPAKYLVDGNGRVRYSHFGEGNYEKTEEMIQTLLAEIN